MNDKALTEFAKDAPLLRAAEGAFALTGTRGLGVAVSGGGDSMALLHMLASLAKGNGKELYVVTFNHGLRPEAQDEANFVKDFCQTLGVPHDTLNWSQGPQAGNLQDQARQARYLAMTTWAQKKDLGCVAVGHTADDQAETVLMGLARASGLDGMSGMRPRWCQENVIWCRPLLNHPRDELREYLRRHNATWMEDPSNENDQFTRIKARKALETLAPLGITAQNVSKVAYNLMQARRALDESVAQVAREISTVVAGEIIIDRDEFLKLEFEVARRLIVGGMKWVSNETYAPRTEAQKRLLTSIQQAQSCTLSGCQIQVFNHEIRIVREYSAVSNQVSAPHDVWDGRWQLTGPKPEGLHVRALGKKGLQECEDWGATSASRQALIVSPAVWNGEQLVAAPVAGMAKGWRAKLISSYVTMLTSH